MQRRLARGLAASAVGALAVTGLAVAPAQAAGVTPRFVSIFNAGHLASTRIASGIPYTDVEVTLTAALTPSTTDAGFEYNTNPNATDASAGWTPTGVTLDKLGDFVTGQWAPDPALIGTTLALRVAATDGTSTAYSTRRGVVLRGDDSPTNAVTLNPFQSDLGYFHQPYAGSSRTRTLTGVTATTSATDGKVALSWWRASDGTFQGRTDAAVTETSMKVSMSPTPVYRDGGTATAALDITAFDADAGDVIALAAERDSDDARPFTLYQQQISQVGTSVGTTGSKGTPVTIYVSDQDSQPVPGVEVRRSSDGTVVGYTDGSGEVIALQPNSTTESYYANATDGDAYDPAVDRQSSGVTTDAYVPQVTSTVAVFADGFAFEDAEYAPGDIVLQVVDQEGSPMASAQSVTWSISPEDGPPSLPTTQTTDAQGRLVIPFDPSLPDGTYALSYSKPGSSTQELTTKFTTGTAVLGLTPAAGAAASGGGLTFTGSLTISGEPVTGRQVTLTYARGQELAPGLVPDAGIVSGGGRALTTSATTKANGTFTVVVSDPTEAGRPTETGGRLTASVLGETRTAAAEFGRGPGRVAVRLSGASKGGAADKLVVDAPSSVPGEKVKLFRKVGKGAWRAILTRRLDRSGNARISVPDTNGADVTQYKAQLLASKRVRSSTSPVRKIR